VSACAAYADNVVEWLGQDKISGIVTASPQIERGCCIRCGHGLDFRDQLFRARALARGRRSDALLAAVSVPLCRFSSASVGAESGK
jgi:hypothetical protein